MAAREYVEYLRGMALESMHGMRADTSKMAAATSSRALEILHQGLIWLADKLRISYGEGALLSLLRMVCKASEQVLGGLLIGGKARKDMVAEELTLVWPRWFSPTADDRQSDAITAKTLVDAGVLSRETALRKISSDYDVEDVTAEAAIIAAETAAADARALAMSAQAKASETLPT